MKIVVVVVAFICPCFFLSSSGFYLLSLSRCPRAVFFSLLFPQPSHPPTHSFFFFLSVCFSSSPSLSTAGAYHVTLKRLFVLVVAQAKLANKYARQLSILLTPIIAREGIQISHMKATLAGWRGSQQGTRNPDRKSERCVPRDTANDTRCSLQTGPAAHTQYSAQLAKGTWLVRNYALGQHVPRPPQTAPSPRDWGHSAPTAHVWAPVPRCPQPPACRGWVGHYWHVNSVLRPNFDFADHDCCRRLACLPPSLCHALPFAQGRPSHHRAVVARIYKSG